MNIFGRSWKPVIYRDADDKGGGGNVDVNDVISNEIENLNKDENNDTDDKGGKGGGDKPAGDTDDKGDDKNKKPDKDADKDDDGEDEDKNKKPDKEKPPADDKEIEIEGVGKIKLSDVQGALKSAKKQGELTKGFQDLAEQKKSLSELESFGTLLKSNPKAFKKFLKAMAEGQDDEDTTIADKKKNEAAKEKAVKELLGDLDTENDPYAKAIMTIFEKLTGLEGVISQAKKEAGERDENTSKNEAREVLTKTMNEMAKELELDKDDEETKSSNKLWRSLTFSFIQQNKKEFKNMEEFVETIKSVSKVMKQEIDKIGEAKLAAYIKSKKLPTTPRRTAAGGGGSDKPDKVEYDAKKDNLQEVLESEVKQVLEKKEGE